MAPKGRYRTPHGYLMVRVGKDHHLADVRGFAYEHRLVAEEMLGRRLKPGEIVHHIDGVKDDNAPSNLVVAGSQHEHSVHHRPAGCVRRLPGEPNPQIQCACGCGESRPKYDTRGRPRLYLPGHYARGRSQGRTAKESEAA